MIRWILSILGFLFWIIPNWGQTTYYVSKTNGNDAHTGLSWNQAFQNLQTALGVIGNDDTIWVATGIYYPDEGLGKIDNNRSESFFLTSGVQVYGGFSGSESMLSERDPTVNLTLLSGDLMQDDAPDFMNRGDNAYHVVSCTNQIAATRLDGFTISGGHANVQTGQNFLGGGMHNVNSSPTIAYCIFTDNFANNTGGGLYNSNADASIIHCSFEQNKTNASGGAVHNHLSTVLYTDCLFQNNESVNFGGAMHNLSSTIEIEKCTFLTNGALNPMAVSSGGGMYSTQSGMTIRKSAFIGNEADRGGGYFFFDSTSLVQNVIVFGNRSERDGGGIYLNKGKHTIINCSLSGNRALFNGGALHNQSNNPTITNTVIWNNRDSTGVGTAKASINNVSSTPVITYSLVQNITTNSNNNLNGVTTSAQLNYPSFILPCDPNTAPNGIGNLRLQTSSALINQGNSGANITSDDFDCQDRLVGTVDLGAFENPFVNCPQQFVVSELYNPHEALYSASELIEVQGLVETLSMDGTLWDAPEVILLPSTNIPLGTVVEILSSGCTN